MKKNKLIKEEIDRKKERIRKNELRKKESVRDICRDVQKRKKSRRIKRRDMKKKLEKIESGIDKMYQKNIEPALVERERSLCLSQYGGPDYLASTPRSEHTPLPRPWYRAVNLKYFGSPLGFNNHFSEWRQDRGS